MCIRDRGGTDNPGDILGKPVTVFAQSEEEALRIMQVVLEKGQWSGEIMGRIMDGSPIAVHVSASLVRNEKGEPICMMDSFVDITGRKRMEEELKIKDFAIASSINGIVIGDLAGNITYVNQAFLDLWGGTSPDEVIGKSALTFAQSPEDAQKILQAVIEGGTWKGEIAARKKSGRLLAVQLSANMVRNADGTPVCLMASFVDITERMVAEQKLQRAYESLEQRVDERTGELVRANVRLKKEIEERKQRYREVRERVPLQGRIVVIVDDGLATGALTNAEGLGEIRFPAAPKLAEAAAPLEAGSWPADAAVVGEVTKAPEAKIIVE